MTITKASDNTEALREVSIVKRNVTNNLDTIYIKKYESESLF